MSEKANIFASASAKAKTTMEKAAKPATKSAKAPEKGINVRMPVELHRKALMHRINTGESMNALIVRLLEKELSE